uniref:Calnexin n=1 Tax=Panagrolaimus superbus TaxID=310955 RepID=A0A914ZB94_9BILA
MKFYLFLYLGLIVTTFITGLKAITDEDDDDVETSAANQYIPPTFIPPTLQEDEVHFLDWFPDHHGIGKKWLKSKAKKDGAEVDLSMYNGEWFIGAPVNIVAENDFGLVVKTKARHHAIAANLREPFDFSGKPLIVQYEVKYEEGQECGGGYIKLLSAGAEKQISMFTDRTPYTIMFGPDKCGQSAKVHLIFKIKNPKNGTISEHHIKESGKNLVSYFEDKQTHLYTLKVTPENDFSVQVDNSKISSGNLLKDLIPPVEPEKEIADPSDVKPETWDEREFIVDPEAVKPENWDETQPKEIVDENAVIPSDWNEDEEPLIPDPKAKQPEDWDTELDGQWEAKLIDNPACAGISGCGKWSAPMIPNPEYKGKWIPPKISNPEYKGKWTPKMIENPNYYEPNPYKQLEKITAIGFELWTMSSGIIFDNILITDDENIAHRFAAETFTIKKDLEGKYTSAKNPSTGIFQSLIDATEDKPWLWAVYVIALLIPTILIAVLCFGRKTSSPVTTAAAHHKKTDERDDEDEEEEEIENIEPEAEVHDDKGEEIVEEEDKEETPVVTYASVVEDGGTKSDAESQKSGKSGKSNKSHKSPRASPKVTASTAATTAAPRQRRPRKE